MGCGEAKAGVGGSREVIYFVSIIVVVVGTAEVGARFRRRRRRVAAERVEIGTLMGRRSACSRCCRFQRFTGTVAPQRAAVDLLPGNWTVLNEKTPVGLAIGQPGRISDEPVAVQRAADRVHSAPGRGGVTVEEVCRKAGISLDKAMLQDVVKRKI